MGFCAYLILYYGLVFGILDWVSDIIYYSSSKFSNPSLQKTCIIFIIIQPLWYIFLYSLYVSTHNEIQSKGERFKKILIAPIYSLLQYTKLIANVEAVHKFFIEKFNFRDEFVFLTLENCFKVQVFSELFFQTLPQIIIQCENNNKMKWSGIAVWSLIMQLAILIKDFALFSVYFIRKIIENQDNPQIRPKTQNINISRIGKDTMNMQGYLMNGNDDEVDEEGNTSIHQLTKGEDLSILESQIISTPHLLFMLNKNGQTPLDLAIQDKDDHKAILLMKKMQKFNINCGLKYVKKPHRLETRYEKSYCLAIQLNKGDILSNFPQKSLKTVHVSMIELKDYKKYKDSKALKEEISTTPLHLACKHSNYDAMRFLIDQHNFDINILLNEKSPLYELLSTACYDDFNILNYMMKKRKPQINSGERLPLNQAILRGNPMIIKTLIEFGNPNPFVQDSSGKYYIHVAAAKLDIETMKLLIEKGADPMTPDNVGNTILHLLAYGTIKDVEYDFIRAIVIRFSMRLTRNQDNLTPLNLLRKYTSKQVAQRGQPNYRRKIQEFFEQRLIDEQHFQDSDKNEELHEAIIRGSLDTVKEILHQRPEISGSLEKQMFILEQRNYEGKTAIMIAVEHERDLITNYLLDNFPELDITKKDSQGGNTPLHIACHKQDVQIVQRLFKLNERLCLQANYLGQTPFHIVVDKRNFQMLDLFTEYKHDSLLLKDCNGDTPLSLSAREGNSQIFAWFQGHIDYFKARGEQNYKGQTIEHIVCIYKKLEIVDAIKPRPDTRDFYGNLPIFYSIMQNDAEMIKKYFTKGRDYFLLRNYKYETVFHVAARYNSLEALKALLGKSVFIEELLKKDFKGDTPMNIAATHCNIEILEFFVRSCTQGFMEVQNDFGLTPIEEVKEKLRLFQDKVDQGTVKKSLEDIQDKVGKTQRIIDFLQNFNEYIDEEKWNLRFDVPLGIYLDKMADPNLKTFMGMENVQFVTSQHKPAQVGNPPAQI